ncbi:(Fe-S)-binding protein [Chloroflexota bacterium]
MKKNKKIKLHDISKNSDKVLSEVKYDDLMPLPFPTPEKEPIGPLKDEWKENYEHSFDGTIAVAIPKPKSKAEEEELVEKFKSGLKKLFTKENNWTFLQPLTLSMENCVKCQTCSEACPIYVASGYNEIYRPTYRSEILRRLYNKYVKPGGGLLAKISGDDIELNWTTIARLAESAYRCTLCRRCAQTCPIGVDNGLITHELRKLLSSELGIAPKELHEKGTVQQLEVGASTGWAPKNLYNVIEFMEEEIEEKTGRKIKIPVDKKGADILLIHNAGEFVSWPENPAAFAVILEEAGISWTLSSQLVGYDAVNYGVWYDDVQLAKVAYQHARAAKELGVNRIVVGECGHAHKALIVVADRALHRELNIPRESCMPLLEEIVFSGKLKLDPMRNNFPITLHDPCNMVRLEGIVEPQRRVLRHIAPQLREMTENGVHNYCCGGGAGFAIMNSFNIDDWRLGISSRMKVKQIMEAFKDCIGPETMKFICAPCSNCKGQIREMIQYYDLENLYNIHYTGLVEFIVNAMVDTPMYYIEEVEEMMEEVASAEEGVQATAK